MTNTIKSLGISTAFSIIAAIITSRLTLRQDMKKRIYSQREESYIETFALLEKLKSDPYLVFNKDFITSLNQIQPKLMLFASQDVIDIFDPFYKNVMETVQQYWKQFDGEEYEFIKMFREEHGDTQQDFDREEQLYMDNNILDQAQTENFVRNIACAMRRDFGSKPLFVRKIIKLIHKKS